MEKFILSTTEHSFFIFKLIVCGLCEHFYKTVGVGSFDQEYNLPLQSSFDGKTSMTGMILPFPGVPPTGNETKRGVRTSTNTSITVRACVRALHTMMR